jgi:predicted HD phosphohydrolase
LEVEFGNSGEKETGVWMEGMAKEFFPACHLHDLSHIHDRYSITDVLDDSKIVRDEKVGEAKLVSQVHEEVQNLSLNGHIKG